MEYGMCPPGTGDPVSLGSSFSSLVGVVTPTPLGRMSRKGERRVRISGPLF
ncbi:unnamed protein product [Ascophyllum nodosum]